MGERSQLAWLEGHIINLAVFHFKGNMFTIQWCCTSIVCKLGSGHYLDHVYCVLLLSLQRPLCKSHSSFVQTLLHKNKRQAVGRSYLNFCIFATAFYSQLLCCLVVRRQLKAENSVNRKRALHRCIYISNMGITFSKYLGNFSDHLTLMQES